MAESKVVGNDFFLRLVVNEEEIFIVCEQNSDFSVSAEPVTVLCKNNAGFEEIVGSGTKSGAANYTGVYVKDPESPNLSAFDLIALAGTTQEFVYGGTEVGDDKIEFEGFINNVSITSNTNEAITFSFAANLTGEPIAGKVTS